MRPDAGLPADSPAEGRGDGRADGKRPSGGLTAALAAFRQATAGRALDAMDLAASELRLAAMAALTMLVMGLLAFAALLAAWVFLVMALVLFVTEAGWSWPVTALAVSGLHLIAGALLYRQVMKLTADLTLPATRAAFRARPSEPL